MKKNHAAICRKRAIRLRKKSSHHGYTRPPSTGGNRHSWRAPIAEGLLSMIFQNTAALRDLHQAERANKQNEKLMRNLRKTQSH